MSDFIECPICGAMKQMLVKHITMAHGMTAQEVYDTYGHLQLVGDKLHNKISTANHNNWISDPDYAERCSSYWRSDLHAKRKSVDMTNQWRDKEKREIMRDGITRYSLSEEGRKRRSETAASTLVRILQQQGNRFNTKSIEYNGIHYRSSLEVEFAKLFDSLNLDYEYESVSIPYKDIYGHPKTYVLDFYIESLNTIIEVKPTQFLDSLDYGKKQAAENSSYKYVILTDEDTNISSVKNKLLN